jgi:hypothetical protein
MTTFRLLIGVSVLASSPKTGPPSKGKRSYFASSIVATRRRFSSYFCSLRVNHNFLLSKSHRTEHVELYLGVSVSLRAVDKLLRSARPDLDVVGRS